MQNPVRPQVRFGEWSGRPRGVPADPKRCNYEVFPYRGLHYQCTRTKGYGPGALYCKQHAKMLLDGGMP